MFGKKKNTADAKSGSAKSDNKKSKSSATNRPLLLAALAALLAVAGALAMLWVMAGRNQNVVDEIVASNEATIQVLVVAEAIPAGTSIDQILNEPTRYLTAKQYPESAIPDNVFFEANELEDFRGLTASVDLVPGEQLLKDRFADPSSFTQDTFIQRTSVVKPPEGHQSFVLSLPADRALGGNVRAGDKVAVLGSFTFNTEEESTDVSLVVLPEVEVIQVQATDAGAGQLGAEIDDVGLASLATYVLTVAVTPAEMADLTYVIEYGQVRLAGALEGSSPEDDRAYSTMATVLGGAINPRTSKTFDLGSGSKTAGEFNVGKNAEETENAEDGEGSEGSQGEGAETQGEDK